MEANTPNETLNDNSKLPPDERPEPAESKSWYSHAYEGIVILAFLILLFSVAKPIWSKATASKYEYWLVTYNVQDFTSGQTVTSTIYAEMDHLDSWWHKISTTIPDGKGIILMGAWPCTEEIYRKALQEQQENVLIRELHRRDEARALELLQQHAKANAAPASTNAAPAATNAPPPVVHNTTNEVVLTKTNAAPAKATL